MTVPFIEGALRLRGRAAETAAPPGDSLRMKWLWGTMAVLIVLLQVRLWVGENSLLEAWQLHEHIERQKEINAGLEARNAELFAEVSNLADGSRAIEERGRVNLGMIGENETFFLMVDP